VPALGLPHFLGSSSEKPIGSNPGCDRGHVVSHFARAVTGVTTPLTCDFPSIKSPDGDADTQCMNTSQVCQIQPIGVAFGAGVPRVHHAIDDVSVDVVQAAILVAENTPDPRADRVEMAIVRLDSGELDARTVATAMISTILADSHR
jgi:hypothetical protein